MKFLFIHQNFPGQFVHLAPALAALGHEVVALGNRAQAPTLPGVRYVAHRIKGLPNELKALGTVPMGRLTLGIQAKLTRADSVARAMTRLKSQGFEPDVVVAHSGWGEAIFVKSMFPSAKLKVYAEYFYGAPGGDVGFDPEFGRNDLAAYQRWAVNNLHLIQALVNADAAISPTAFQRSQHPLDLQKKISVIHDGIDTQQFAPSLAAWVKLGKAGVTLSAGDEVITFVARQLEPYRGYHTFMRALPKLLKYRPNARVVIVGGDGMGYGAAAPHGQTWKQIFLDEVKADLDMARVHFVGKVPHETLTQLLQVSAVHVYLTYPFVLSWSLLEAMSIGCLVVASNTGPVCEVVTDEHNGLLVDFFVADALAHKVAEALENRRALAGLRERARQTVVERFDLKAVCLPQALAWALQGVDVPGAAVPGGAGAGTQVRTRLT